MWESFFFVWKENFGVERLVQRGHSLYLMTPVIIPWIHSYVIRRENIEGATKIWVAPKAGKTRFRSIGVVSRQTCSIPLLLLLAVVVVVRGEWVICPFSQINAIICMGSLADGFFQFCLAQNFASDWEEAEQRIVRCWSYLQHATSLVFLKCFSRTCIDDRSMFRLRRLNDGAA